MKKNNQRGVILILSFMVLLAMTSLVAAYLYMTSVLTKSSGFAERDDQALWLAEAGMNKAVWNLYTTTGGGGLSEDWTTAGTSEDLGGGSYTMVVERWDWALSANASTASASSEASGKPATNVNDGSDATSWESTSAPSVASPEWIKVDFPDKLTLNKARFLIASGNEHTPRNYKWQVSKDGGATWIDALSVTSNGKADVTDEFSPQIDVDQLRLRVTLVGIVSPPGGPPGLPRVRLATLEALGSKVTSTGTVDSISRKIEQTFAIDDATTYAYGQIDWDEIAP